MARQKVIMHTLLNNGTQMRISFSHICQVHYNQYCQSSLLFIDVLQYITFWFANIKPNNVWKGNSSQCASENQGTINDQKPCQIYIWFMSTLRAGSKHRQAWALHIYESFNQNEARVVYNRFLKNEWTQLLSSRFLRTNSSQFWSAGSSPLILVHSKIPLMVKKYFTFWGKGSFSIFSLTW